MPAIDSRRAPAAGGTAKIDNRGQTVGNYSETETVWDQLRSINMADAAVDERGRLTEANNAFAVLQRQDESLDHVRGLAANGSHEYTIEKGYRITPANSRITPAAR